MSAKEGSPIVNRTRGRWKPTLGRVRTTDPPRYKLPCDCNERKEEPWVEIEPNELDRPVPEHRRPSRKKGVTRHQVHTFLQNGQAWDPPETRPGDGREDDEDSHYPEPRVRRPSPSRSCPCGLEKSQGHGHRHGYWNGNDASPQSNSPRGAGPWVSFPRPYLARPRSRKRWYALTVAVFSTVRMIACTSVRVRLLEGLQLPCGNHATFLREDGLPPR
jgi:hypothetical protein